MVSYNTAGRMGNALFMAANCISYAMKHGLEFSIPNTTTHSFWNPTAVMHLHNHKWNPALETVTVLEPHFHYAPIPFEETWRYKNIILQGYYQSPMYIDEYRDKIIELFNFPWKCKSDVCSLHGRFGDYREIVGKHIIIDELYIRSAIELIKKEKGISRFKVFSDDIPFFKSNFGHIYDFEYSTNSSIEEDLVEISCCHSNIGSSSTFSWWGAYLNLNSDKIVIQQSKWFQDGWKDEYGRDVNTKDIIPPEWIKL